MDSQLTSGIVAAVSTLVAAGMGFWVNDRLDRRQRREARELRNHEEKIRIAEDIIAADASLTEYLNDHWEQIDTLTPDDMAEPLELWRVMNRAHKRARIYFSSTAVGLIVRQLGIGSQSPNSPNCHPLNDALRGSARPSAGRAEPATWRRHFAEKLVWSACEPRPYCLEFWR
jgi:hypothetical protein